MSYPSETFKYVTKAQLVHTFSQDMTSLVNSHLKTIQTSKDTLEGCISDLFFKST